MVEVRRAETEPPLDLPTVAAGAALATAGGIALHEGAHALVGAAMGGVPTLVTSIGVEGHWSTLRNAGHLLLGTSGSAANLLVALSGWLVFRRSVGRPTTWGAVAWLFFAVNAWAAAMYLIASPALGFGDWMRVLDRFANLGPMRVSAAVTGLFVTGLLWKGTVRTISQLAGNGPPDARVRRVTRLARTAWVTSGAIAVGAALLHPGGTLRGAAIAAGSTLGSSWPILLAARRAGETPVRGAPLRLERSVVVLAAGLAAGVALIVVLGPGLRLR